MQNNKLKIGLVEFYITNVCNLTCQGCNRFNSYKFTGYQKWSDYKDVYTQWASEIQPSSIGILGGEPLLNPTYMEWLSGIRALWPNTMMGTTTNGYRLNKINGLYDFIHEHKENTFLSVGIHNKKHTKMIMGHVQSFLKGPLKYQFNHRTAYHKNMIITDSNDVKLQVEYNWWFHQGAIVNNGESLTLHNSDPQKAHDICHSKTCHHFMNGELYKCGAVALFPEFDKQHKLSLSQEDREIMESYRPLRISDDFSRKQTFIKELRNPIAQCKFCPEVYKGEQIFAEEKKVIKIHAKTK